MFFISFCINQKDVLNLRSFSKMVQQVPNGFFVADGLEWKETIKYKIPEDAVSGLYSLQLTQEGKNQYTITFVVQPRLNQNFNDKNILAMVNTDQLSNNGYQSLG